MTAREDRPRRRLESLHRRVEELTTDIGCVLHANTSTLFMVHQALDVAIRALGPSPFSRDDAAPATAELDAALTGPSRIAARAVESLLGVLAREDRKDAAPPEHVAELGGFVPILDDFAERIPIAESRAHTLRTIACRIQDIVDGIPPGRLPREALRNARRAASDIERLTALATLLQARSGVIQMDYSIRSFREFITADLRRSEPTQRLDVASLIDEARRQLAEYAHSSGVRIAMRHEAGRAQVIGSERELVRALGNLMHNAIKYTWHREGGQQPWVEIRVARKDGEIHVSFENWGVPIDDREITTGVIFELGYRGKWSTDRGRLGTGIGLTDSRDIIERHRGHMLVSSRPARSWGPDDPDDESYYRQPFVTTITACLPEAL